MSILFVAVGGFFGSILRYYISQKAKNSLTGTWIANITGSIIFAIVLNLFLSEIIRESFLLFLGVGFCGSYTTFSTFGNEALQLLLEKKYLRAVTYVGSSLGLSLLFVIAVYAIF